jgi:hypothetical protein
MSTPRHAPPRAPWGKFPLSELTVLLALALAAAGLAALMIAFARRGLRKAEAAVA